MCFKINLIPEKRIRGFGNVNRGQKLQGLELFSLGKRRPSRGGTCQVTQSRRGCKGNNGGLLSASTSGGQEVVVLIDNKRDGNYIVEE